ncbi:unnamed protein product [Ceutorhynchus assimilis]|uniref:Insulin-like domain-containing protein n=1 Tax=Ceutorhynchus assimilis TaxID=467358 RepID=A0A9P0DIC7_9CUCU|nr:unnamed protein product [Ceutorhynchus assimilis]
MNFKVAFLLFYLFMMRNTCGKPYIFSKVRSENTKLRWCGYLDIVMNEICDEFPDPNNMSKRTHLDIFELMEQLEESYEDSSNYDVLVANGESFENRLLNSKHKRDGLVSECCHNTCSLKFMRENYCVKAKPTALFHVETQF